ncbi:unnamed protein product [Adineta steineri]|uniref:Secreted protein n=1 Tax=Adineta steineri TaxID=433720 RepID=A0A815KQQ8_9BILA|nr:unnamed protein product [Adineta steineri]CAF4080910.1 unnamed protein product [Adineta steineri]
MAKLLYFALVFMCMSGVALGHGGGGHGGSGGLLSLIQAIVPQVSVCTNATSFSALLTTAFTTCQANTDCNNVLTTRLPNTAAYWNNPTSKPLLTTSCSTFITNFVAALTADSTAECAKQKIYSDLNKQIHQAGHTATGSVGHNELDFKDSCGCQ